MDRRVQVGVLWRLERAYTGYFKKLDAYRQGSLRRRPGLPRFKSEGRWRTIEPRGVGKGWFRPRPDGRRADLLIKGLPRMTLKLGRYALLPEKDNLVSVRLTRRGLRIVASLTYSVTMLSGYKNGSSIGLFFGVNRRVSTSNGEHFQSVRRNDRKRTLLQRRMVRQRNQAIKEGRAKWVGAGFLLDSDGRRKPSRRFHWLETSKTYLRSRDMLSNLNYKETIRNRNECHRITSDIVARYDFVALPAYDIQSMTRSARGSIEKPGRGVARKTRANQEVLAQTWGTLRGQLAYKAEWAGKQYITVDPKGISNRCLECGNVNNASRKPNNVFRCRVCGHVADSAVNAACNILNQGNADLLGLDPDGMKLLSSGAAGSKNNSPDRESAP